MSDYPTESSDFAVQVVGAAIVDSLDGPRQILVARRSAPEALAGLWEFPGGKVEPEETCEQALQRELSEELGIESILGQEISGPLMQGWQLNDRAAMRVWTSEISAGNPQPLQDHSELRWVNLDETVLELDWIPADFPIVQALLETL